MFAGEIMGEAGGKLLLEILSPNDYDSIRHYVMCLHGVSHATPRLFDFKPNAYFYEERELQRGRSHKQITLSTCPCVNVTLA